MTAEDHVTAAEFAIGLLEGVEHARAADRATFDPAFALEVDWWQRQLAPLYAQGEDVPPPAGLRERIEARLVDAPALAPRSASRRRERGGAGRWRFVGIGGALGALAASLVAWLLPVTAVPTPPPAPVAIAPHLLVAALAPTADSPKKAIVALLDRDTAALRLSDAIEVPSGRAAQLWRIPANGKPVSLGVVGLDAGRALSVTRSHLPRPGDQLAISVEPAGGSPTGQPTGPVILTGLLSDV